MVVLPGAAVADAPVVLSEFGGISLDADGEEAGGTFSDAGWSGYGAVHDPARLLAGYRELVGALLDSPAVAGFCWTQLADTQQERNGLVTAARRPKVPVGDIRAVTTRVSAAVPGDAVGEFAYGDYSPAATGGDRVGADVGGLAHNEPG